MGSKKSTFCFDIECMPNLFTAIFKNIKTKEYHDFIIFHDELEPIFNKNDLPQFIKFLETDVLTVVGYNNHEYDDMMLKHLLIFKDTLLKHADPQSLTKQLKIINDKIISKGKFEREDKYIRELRDKKFFGSIDLFKLFNTIDRTSLKQVAVNMKWHSIQDMPIHHNSLVNSNELPDVISYNRNDVDITEALLERKKADIKLRKNISKEYNVNVINANDTEIAKAIIAKFYCEGTGVNYADIKDLRTHMKIIKLSNCVSKKIWFCTRPFYRCLNTVKHKEVTPFKSEKEDRKYEQEYAAWMKANPMNEKRPEKDTDESKAHIFHYDIASKYVTHTMKRGGIHSVNKPEIFVENDDFEYIDIDVEGYYPRIIVYEGLYPRHLSPNFVSIYKEKIVDMRDKVKALIDQDDKYKIPYEGVKKTANGTFGLTKSKYSWLYDPQIATYICITGELFLLMLVERIEQLTDCIVVYSNTDGLTVRVPKVEKEYFMKICRHWMRYTGFKLEFINYRKMVIKDINNYLMVTSDEKKPVKEKGMFSTSQEITKGYNFPIVKKALRAYYIDGINFRDTIRKSTDIFDFIKSQRTDQNKFSVQHLRSDATTTELHKTNRWIVTKGNSQEGVLVKVHRLKKKRIGTREANIVHELQKDRKVTIVNDIKEFTDVANMHIDYEFYDIECCKVIKEIKEHRDEDYFSKSIQTNKVKQGSLL